MKIELSREEIEEIITCMNCTNYEFGPFDRVKHAVEQKLFFQVFDKLEKHLEDLTCQTK